MVDVSLIQPVSQVATALGVCIAAIYYVMNMRAQNRNREAQLFMNIANQSFINQEWNNAYKLFISKNWHSAEELVHLIDWPNDNEFGNAYALVAGLFESLGVLVKENLIDIRMVALLMASYCKGFFGKIAPHIKELRVTHNAPRMLSETEYLYNKLNEYLKEHPELET